MKPNIEVNVCKSPNDPKLSDCGARRAGCAAGSAGSSQRDARSSSLQRMVRRAVVVIGLISLEWAGCLMPALGCDNLLGIRCSRIDAKMVEQEVAEDARNNVAAVTDAETNEASSGELLAILGEILANADEHLKLSSALIRVGVALREPTTHKLTARLPCARLGVGVAMGLDKLRERISK